MKLLLICLVFLLSCSKPDEKDCYYCTFGNSPNGQPNPPKSVCIEPWEDIADIKFQDGNGNDLSSLCTRQ